MGQTQVDTAALRSLGVQVGQHAETLRQAVTGASGQLAPAGAAQSAWAVPRQAATAAAGWAQLLSGLAERLGTAGQSMVTTAGLYEAADQRAADRMPR